MTDSAKAPSKGAIKSARGVLDLINEGNPRLRTSEMAELTDRETKAGEMADLLRLTIWKYKNGYTATDINHWMETANLLLTELEGKAVTWDDRLQSEKRCDGPCNETKPAEEFAPIHYAKPGLRRQICRACVMSKRVNAAFYVLKKVVRIDVSPMNRKVKCHQLECGHELWLPRRSRKTHLPCEKCVEVQP